MAVEESENSRQLRAENEELRARLAEAEDTLRALRGGEVDALVIHDAAGPRVFTIKGAEHAYRLIVETMSEGAVTATLEGTVLYGNNALSRMLGTPLSRIMGRQLQELVLEECLPQLAELLAQTRSGSARERLVLRMADGSGRPAYFSTALLPQDGEAPHICMVLTDLAALEAAGAELQAAREREKILAASEERFRLFAEAVPTIVWTVAPDGKADFTNQRWTEFTGMPAPSGHGLGWEAILHPEDQEATRAAWRQALATAQPYQIEHRLRRADGVYRWHLSRALPLLDEKGRISRWYGTSTDIDDQKRITEALRESQLRLRLATEAARIGIWAWDPRGQEMVCSRECKEVIGLAQDSRMELESLLQIVHPDDRSMVRQAIGNVLQASEEYDLVFRAGPREGNIRWLQMKGKVFGVGSQAQGHLHGVVMDITKARESQEELQKLTDQLARSNQELKEFAYIASHDLQEPLRVITGFLDLLRRRYRGRLDAQADEFIDYAVNGAARMHNLIRDLLNYSRVGSSNITLAAVAAEEIVDQALADLRVSIEETGASISCASLPVVQGDATLLRQLFQNLISNGIKFHGEQPPAIRIAAAPRQGEWLFSVEDKGIGLEPRQAERIFQIFQRLHTADKYQGTGIGLAVCKKIVERHGGRIWVESQPGEGATFYFTLPRQAHEGERQ